MRGTEGLGEVDMDGNRQIMERERAAASWIADADQARRACGGVRHSGVTARPRRRLGNAPQPGAERAGPRPPSGLIGEL